MDLDYNLDYLYIFTKRLRPWSNQQLEYYRAVEKRKENLSLAKNPNPLPPHTIVNHDQAGV